MDWLIDRRLTKRLLSIHPCVSSENYYAMTLQDAPRHPKTLPRRPQDAPKSLPENWVTLGITGSTLQKRLASYNLRFRAKSGYEMGHDRNQQRTFFFRSTPPLARKRGAFACPAGGAKLGAQCRQLACGMQLSWLLATIGV